MAHVDERGWSSPRRLLTLWSGVLLAPIAWALNLSVNYGLATFACSGPWAAALHVSALVALALSVAGGLIAWRLWTTLARVPDDEGTRAARSRFMAAGGLGLSVLFGVLIVAQWLPTLFIEPCRF
ncbi:MAG TPA: hypothetical protein VM364_04510 [Vicinamibacterales bacterium]|nr:hypothetical protein [Vicinamibacterales bacterium]